MRESKECEECGGIYFRPEGYTDRIWEARKYCGQVCAGKASQKRIRAAQAELPADELGSEEEAFTTALEKIPLEKVPVQRELRIVRVGPNPRLIVCEYYELAERRLCTVLVKRPAKFVRGMRFKMAEPPGEMEFRRPWVYEGPMPRHRGRW
jgi:hypothetical protein